MHKCVSISSFVGYSLGLRELGIAKSVGSASWIGWVLMVVMEWDGMLIPTFTLRYLFSIHKVEFINSWVDFFVVTIGRTKFACKTHSALPRQVAFHKYTISPPACMRCRSCHPSICQITPLHFFPSSSPVSSSKPAFCWNITGKMSHRYKYANGASSSPPQQGGTRQSPPSTPPVKPTNTSNTSASRPTSQLRPRR